MLRIFLALWLAIMPAFAWAGSMTLMGVGAPPAAGSNLITLDGTSARSDATSTTATPTLTTTHAGDFILVFSQSNSSLTSTVADVAGLTWTKRASVSPGSGHSEEWWAVAPSPLTADVITVTYAGSTFHTTIAVGLSGVAASSQFDSNVSLPSGSGTATTTFSTTNANDIIFDNCGLSGSTGIIQSGWTSLTNTNFMLVQYQLVTTTQSSATVGPGANFKAQVADAIRSQ